MMICFSTVFCSPSNKTVEVQIDDKSDFSRKLADLYFMDSWVSRTTKDEKDSIKNMLYTNFEDLHGISVVEFHKKLEELKTDPIMFAEIMDSVGFILKNKGKKKK